VSAASRQGEYEVREVHGKDATQWPHISPLLSTVAYQSAPTGQHNSDRIRVYCAGVRPGAAATCSAGKAMPRAAAEPVGLVSYGRIHSLVHDSLCPSLAPGILSPASEYYGSHYSNAWAMPMKTSRSCRAELSAFGLHTWKLNPMQALPGKSSWFCTCNVPNCGLSICRAAGHTNFSGPTYSFFTSSHAGLVSEWFSPLGQPAFHQGSPAFLPTAGNRPLWSET